MGGEVGAGWDLGQRRGEVNQRRQAEVEDGTLDESAAHGARLSPAMYVSRIFAVDHSTVGAAEGGEEMGNLRLREWQRLDFYDPKPQLIELRRLETSGMLDGLPAHVKHLRTRGLKPYLERRQCALFAFLMGKKMGTPVAVAYSEQSDYDAVMKWRLGDQVRFAPVQMKELPPDRGAETRDLQHQIDRLKVRYPRSSDLTVAIHLNRNMRVLVSELDLSGLNLAALWFFGGDGANRWWLTGDLLSPNASTQVFDYPQE